MSFLTHTEVPYAYSGQGIGTALATGVFNLIRASGRKAVLKCSFMVRFYATHRQYDDIVAAGWGAPGQAARRAVRRWRRSAPAPR